MQPKRKKQIDPLEREMEGALMPGIFISYRNDHDFIEDLEAVCVKIGKLIKIDPKRAIRLYETFIAACYEKTDEIHDDGCGFGSLIKNLFCGWIKACQAVDSDREKLARELLHRMDNDPYGFCYDLEKETVKVFDKKGLGAFISCVREKFETTKKTGKDEKGHDNEYLRRRWGEVLKTIYVTRRDIKAYIAFCEETDIEADECKTIAEIYRARKRFTDALAWIERGMEIARTAKPESCEGYEFSEIKRDLLAKLGRGAEALDSAWEEFQKHPGTFNYEELMQYVPAKEKRAWHEKAMQQAEQGELGDQIELWLKLKEIKRLAMRLGRATDAEMENLSHYQTEPAVIKLVRFFPDVAARLYRALGLRIVNAGKSKYYHIALDHFESAKKFYIKADRTANWDTLVADIRERHYRKSGFMEGFEKIVTGVRKPEPTFMERAKKRWLERS